MSKIQIWKRVTTYNLFKWFMFELYLICQRYKFESESQPYSFSLQSYCAVFNMSKIQIWKRITTPLLGYQIQVVLYLICQRYKFESESQRSPLTSTWNRAVFNMSKIQIWKRITTCDFIVYNPFELYLICQRYKFESESQLPGMNPISPKGCI